MNFIDEVNILVASGNGGPGCVSFRRETHVPRGGPDGGDGGKGGDIIFKVNPDLNSLMDLRYKKVYRAKNGMPGSGSLCSGSDGEDLEIQVPLGTMIRDINGKLLVDLDKKDEVITLLKGGRGGKGNHFFRSSINQAPDRAQPGEKGEELEIKLELKLLADVGLIGYPNAGKSTFISKISAAKPKIADYPFTTLVPNLGVVKIDTEKSFVVADIPGLIEGAAEGVGLGSQFLRHIERTKVFVHLIDISEFNPRNPYSDYIAINKELAEYDKLNKDKVDYLPLCQRPQLVVLNKIDSVDEERTSIIENEFEDNKIKFLKASAVTGEGVKDVLTAISKIVFKDVDE
ncbi:MAG: GTPase ObgE [Bdellovibrionales bacterium]|nr:GTPase ObgE [Bdellovibrionales bacterium]